MRNILFLLVSLSFVSCATLKFDTTYKDDWISTSSADLIIASHISKLDVGKETIESEIQKNDISKLNEIIKKHTEISFTIIALDDVEKNERSAWLATQARFLSKIPDFINDLIIKNENRYLIVISHTGFYRTVTNMVGKAAKGILLGVITLGSVYTTPIAAKSNIDFCIIDKENSKIVATNFNYISGDPLNELIIKNQIDSIFKDLLKIREKK